MKKCFVKFLPLAATVLIATTSPTIISSTLHKIWVAVPMKTVSDISTTVTTRLKSGSKDVFAGTIYKIQCDKVVDLGPNFSVLWATCNVGAENPGDYGDYYSWGEKEPYYSSLNPLAWKTGKGSGYDPSEYYWPSYCFGTDPNNLTKYNGKDGYTELQSDDFPTNMPSGDGWRIPTATNGETSAMQQKYQGRGTIKTDTMVVNFITTMVRSFFPSSGTSPELNTRIMEIVVYWSSTLITSNVKCTDYLCINMGGNSTAVSTTLRAFGSAYRPVREIK